uniref:ZP domain-containing protein n=1 Tax=Leptobrachium leishanense TaxID=445787 RepID=A0A8C5QX09_9ANUR
MVDLLHGIMMPRLLLKHSLNAWILLVIGSLFMISDAANVLDFPGPISCLKDGVQIQKPRGIRLAKWKSLHVVDITGAPSVGCSTAVEGKMVNIPGECMDYELESRFLHIAFKEPIGQDKVLYRIVCERFQADEAARGEVVHCQSNSMSTKVQRTLSPISDEVVAVPPRPWDIFIHDGTRFQLVTVGQARQQGYILTSDDEALFIEAFYNASGLRQYKMGNQIAYVGAVRMTSRSGTPRLLVDVPMACVTGTPSCNETYMTIAIPAFGGDLAGITMEGVDIALNPTALAQNGIVLETQSGGLHLNIKKSFLKVDVALGYNRYSLTSLILTFLLDGLTVSMQLSPTCVNLPSPQVASCTHNGFMWFEILEDFTSPKLNLDTVIFGDGTCRPWRTQNRLVYNVSLNSCGTRKLFVDGRIFYENEAHALWKDAPRRISRDSELRLTVRCYYNTAMNTPLRVQVVTLPPPVSSKSEGPLVFTLDLFPDDTFRNAYSEGQYPVVKTLRDPIYVEMRILNRNDPNLELVLDDCWATMSRDPTAVPQWNMVVDGCQEEKDNFQTVFHPVHDVDLPTHRKRFQVKTFAFVTSGEATTSLIFFHCSAVICDTLAPDSPLCTTRCPSSKKRDAVHVSKDSSVVSLPGPILLTTPRTSIKTQDETSVLEHLVIGLIPAFALAAVIIVVGLHFILKNTQ